MEVFPSPYNSQVPHFKDLASILNSEIITLFSNDIEILAEPRLFIVATTVVLVSEIIGKACRDGKVYYTFFAVEYMIIGYQTFMFLKKEKKKFTQLWVQLVIVLIKLPLA